MADGDYALGIDLGTTFTAAAIARGGRAQVVTLGSKAAAIPSVAFLKEDGSFLVGEAAIRRAATDPSRVAREFKRRIGDPTPILLGRAPYGAEALMARLLRATVDAVTEREGGPPQSVAVSHPANWGPYKLDLLMQAVRMADVRVDRYLTEAEAAAISWAAAERVAAGTVVAVYDLGGGTFDAAVLRKTERDFAILGEPEGIERLGGIDFDQALFVYTASALDGAIEALDPTDPGVLAALARLRQEVVDAKEALSTDTDATIPVLLPGLSTEVRVTRAEFESMIRPPLTDTVAALRRALRSAGVTPDDIGAIVLVGGSSRIPLVAELVGDELGRPVAVDAHPKHAVALGAALAAAGDTPIAAPVVPAAPADEEAPEPRVAILDATPQPREQPPPPRKPAPPAPTPPVAPRSRARARGRVRAVLIGGLVGALVVVAGVAALALSSGGGSGSGGRGAAATGSGGNAHTASVVSARAVSLDSIAVQNGTYVVQYTPMNFDAKIADDPSTFHVHFFWDVWTPQQAGTNAASFGVDVGQWQIWDQQVFDAFTVASRPAGASKICAVVGTSTHAVDDPASFDCIAVPR